MKSPSDTSPLAELHVHFGGCVDYRTCIELLQTCPTPNWPFYEDSYRAAFNSSSPAQALFKAFCSGDDHALERFKEVYVFSDGDGGRFERFQAKFNLIMVPNLLAQAIMGQCPLEEGLAQATELCHLIHEQQQRQGLEHIEIRLFLAHCVPEQARTIIHRILTTFAELQGPPRTQLALSLPRWDPMPHWNLVKEFALGDLGQHLVAVDFCAAEEGFPPSGITEFFHDFSAFNRAHPKHALALLYHVGESFDDKSLESAIRWVVEAAQSGAHRLGHAIALGIHPDYYGPHTRTETVKERCAQIQYDLRHQHELNDVGVHISNADLRQELARLTPMEPEDLITHQYTEGRLLDVAARQRLAAEQVRKTGAIIEVCPTSNRRIAGFREDRFHPLHRFLEWNLPIVIASDDPGLFDSALKDEIEVARRMARLSEVQVQSLITRAWESRSELLSGRKIIKR